MKNSILTHKYLLCNGGHVVWPPLHPFVSYITLQMLNLYIVTCRFIFLQYWVNLSAKIWEYKCFMGLPGGLRDHHYMPECKARDSKKRFHLGDCQLCILTIGTQIYSEISRNRHFPQDFKISQKYVMVVMLVPN